MLSPSLSSASFIVVAVVGNHQLIAGSVFFASPCYYPTYIVWRLIYSERL